MTMPQPQPLALTTAATADNHGRGRKARIDPMIGANVRVMRERLGLRQTDLADKAGVAEGTIASVEAGIRATKPEKLEKIAAALGTTVDQLRTGALPDPAARYRDLNDEDLRFAREYHNATTATRMALVRMLRSGQRDFSERLQDLDLDRRQSVVHQLEMEERRQREDYATRPSDKAKINE